VNEKEGELDEQPKRERRPEAFRPPSLRFEKAVIKRGLDPEDEMNRGSSRSSAGNGGPACANRIVSCWRRDRDDGMSARRSPGGGDEKAKKCGGHSSRAAVMRPAP